MIVIPYDWVREERSFSGTSPSQVPKHKTGRFPVEGAAQPDWALWGQFLMNAQVPKSHKDSHWEDL